MSTSELISQIEALPPSLKSEVEDFVAFLAQKQNKKSNVNDRMPGLGKGSFKMADDFDAPLEDFKEYM